MSARAFFSLRKRPVISVVVASYNHESFIQACLQSVLQQDFQDFEIVVTDDGSRDATVQQIRALADPRIHLKVFPQNQGACMALNDAIVRASGRYIAVLNSDDYFLPGKLSAQLHYLQHHHEAGAVFGLPSFVDERGLAFNDPAHKDHTVFNVANRPRHQWLRYLFDEGNAFCHPTALIRREVYQRVGLYDPRLAQVPDLDMWIRLCSRFEMHILAQPLTAFRIRDAQQNASAARPEVVLRDAWERACVLRHYLHLPTAELLQVFPEFADRSGSNAEKLARHALTLAFPFFHNFALQAWFDSLPDGHNQAALVALQRQDPSAWRRFQQASGDTDLYRIYR